MAENHLTDKGRKAKSRLFIDSIGIFFIIISPFVFKLHQYLTGDPEATMSFFGLIFDRNGFVDLNTYGWFLLGKLVPFYLLIIWFLTCKDWWYHIILIPITMYAFQIFEVVYSEDDIVDTKNIIWLLPICMVVIPFVYFIRIKLYDKYVHGIDLEAMEAELQALRAKQGHKKPPIPASADSSDSYGGGSDQEAEKEEKIDLGMLSLSERIDYLLSTRNLENYFRNFQARIQNWLHL